MDKTINEKITEAILYLERHRKDGNLTQVKNDAANIYSTSYCEYLDIWDALRDL